MELRNIKDTIKSIKIIEETIFYNNEIISNTGSNIKKMGWQIKLSTLYYIGTY